MANTYTAKLKMRMPAIGDLDWGDEVNDNTEILECGLVQVLNGNQVASGLVASDGGGLQVDYTAGTVVVNGSEYSISASNKTCSAAQKNWLYVDSAGTVQISTTAPSGQFAMMAMIDADVSSIARIADMRNLAESILSLDIDYVPTNYDLDTSETSEIEQHLAGVDNQIGFMSGLENKLINGCFRFWQRDTAQTASGCGSADRWAYYISGSTQSITRQSFTPGQTDVPGEPAYFSRAAITSSAGASNFAMQVQRIEDVRTLAGQTAILTFYAKADASKNMAIEFLQDFGTGGSSEVSAIEVNTIALTSSWQRFDVEVNIPSISGKTIGAAEDGFLQLAFWFDAGSDFNSRTNSLGQQSGTFDIALVSLKKGTNAGALDIRPYWVEFELCSRFYTWIYNPKQNYLTIGYALASSTYRHTHTFNAKMRAIPTITFTDFDEAGSAFNNLDETDATVLTARYAGFSWYVAASQSSGSAASFGVSYTADAELY